MYADASHALHIHVCYSGKWKLSCSIYFIYFSTLPQNQIDKWSSETPYNKVCLRLLYRNHFYFLLIKSVKEEEDLQRYYEDDDDDGVSVVTIKRGDV